MRHIGIQVYKKGSQSAKLLQIMLNELQDVTYITRNSTTTPIRINWGSTKVDKKVALYLNHPIFVKNAVDKLKTFEILSKVGLPTVSYTTNKETAKQWLNDGFKVVARTLKNSSKGKGIIVIKHIEEFVNAPLYTLYVPKRKEYRVIICGVNTINIMRKFRKDKTKKHSEVRNAKEYNFLEIPETALKTREELLKLSYKVEQALHLYYCAIDIIKDLNTNEYKILEVNTAFGLGEKNSKDLAQCILNKIETRGILDTLKFSKL